MKMKTTMIIIGGGIAGLSAGCYAQMNGYDSTIFEQQSQPGAYAPHGGVAATS